MNIGLLVVFLLGITWTGAGITVTSARRNNCSIRKFYFIGSLWASILLGIYLFISGGTGDFTVTKLPAIMMLAAGSLINGIGQATIMLNLKSGGCAFVYAIPQLGFIIPFLYSGIFWGEQITVLNLLGIITVAIAILLVVPGRQPESEKSPEFRRIMIALTAMLMLGVSQIFVLFPSLPQNAAIKISPITSSFIIMMTTTVCFAILIPVSRSNHKIEIRKLLRYCFLWGSFAAASALILFWAFRLMSLHGQAGVVFPIACSSEIIIYTVFTRVKLKEKLNARQLISLTAIILGIFMIKFRS